MAVPLDPSTPNSLVGAMVIAVMALSGVVVFLFKHYTKREDDRRDSDKKIAEERMGWAVERAKLEVNREQMRNELRAEFEEKHRTVVAEHAKHLREAHEAERKHEEAMRREYTAAIDSVAAKASEASDKIGAVIDKIYDRFVMRKPH